MVLTPYQDLLMVFYMLINLSRALCSTYVDESSCCFFPFKVSIYQVIDTMVVTYVFYVAVIQRFLRLTGTISSLTHGRVR